MRGAPRAVIFDYGNVLSQPQPAADVQAMAAILNLPAARFSEIYWQFRVPYDAAALAPAEYWNTVAQTAARSLTPQQIEALIEIDSRSWSHAAPITPQWARDLRASGLRTAILSNMPIPVRDYILGRAWLPDFNVRVFSCDVRRTKPAPEIYEHCLQQLGIDRGQTLFLDDREANVRAAEALGLPAVLFTDPAAAFLEIAERFHLPAPGPR
ncbi:MAG TPA: HAD family phosphatase [Bryobacteraceae bacterium]|nr:HAD family phosphatase [Bryobacteraceae bacterium]